MVKGCKWVDDTVSNVPYGVISEELMDSKGCAWVSHGDDLIVLPGEPGMYSEAEARAEQSPRPALCGAHS